MMSRARLFIGLFQRLARQALPAAALMLGGCDQSPSHDALMSDLASYVESGTAPGLLDVLRAERLDHLILPDLNRDRRDVSFVADLRLKRDYDFSSWEQANGATLLLLMGARAQDLQGLKAGGNKAGDVIHVTGTLAYIRTDRLWRLEAGVAPSVESKSTANTPGRLALLEQWRRISAMTFGVLRTPMSGVLTEDLSAAVKTASAHLARQKGGLAVASGPRGGDYWKLADAIAKAGTPQAAPISDRPAEPLVNLATQGGRENLQLLRNGAVTAIILRADEAALAAKGEGPFEHDGTFPDLRALASLLPEALHVVVMGTSPVASVADLFGRRVIIVADGTTTKLEAGDVLNAHRVALAALANTPDEAPVQSALQALKRGEQDAVILTAPAPSSALHDFAAINAVRLLPMDADAVALLTTGTSSYVAVTIPSQTYPGQARPIATVGVSTLLVSSDRVSPIEAGALLTRVFAEFDFMHLGSPFGAMIKISTARHGVTLPLHGGADAFFGTSPGTK